MNVYKKLRKEKNLTQVEAAHFLCVEQSTVSKWELDKAIPDPGLLPKIATFYGTTIDELLGSTPLRSEYQPAPQLSEAERECLVIFRQLDFGRQREGIGYLKALQKEMQGQGQAQA